ncbi:MAG: slipin family protein [Gammaproteobacteria bacterium]
MEFSQLLPLVLALGAVALLVSSIRILTEYERAVVFTLGRLTGTRGPGLIFVIPGIQEYVRVDIRTRTSDIPQQDVITKDNISVRVNAVLYYRILDPARAIVSVANFAVATEQLGQTTLRSVLGQHELDDVLSGRDTLSNRIQSILDKETDAWGIKVSNVELKHVDLDETMIRAMARQAEAERARRAKVIHAEGEREASTRLVEAATMLGKESTAIQLRYLQTLTEITKEGTHTLVFPLPVNGLGSVMDAILKPKSKP